MNFNIINHERNYKGGALRKSQKFLQMKDVLSTERRLSRFAFEKDCVSIKRRTKNADLQIQFVFLLQI